MRTAVVRVNVDPQGEADEAAFRADLARLAQRAAAEGMELLSPDAAPPAHRREVQVLLDGDDPDAMEKSVIALCAAVFGTEPQAGTMTFISRGTDSDALGVLAGMGVTGEIERTPGEQGFDLVTVRLPRAELDRVPESRIHTALEAALNCEIVIVTV
jgi:hypothetical protein